MSLACNAIQCNAIQSAERKKSSSWRNDEQARRTKAVETRAAEEERAKEVAAAAARSCIGTHRTQPHARRRCVHATLTYTIILGVRMDGVRRRRTTDAGAWTGERAGSVCMCGLWTLLINRT